MERIQDIVIIGAGLSGLQAASDLLAAGRSVVVLEARDRVGGKTHSLQRTDGNGIQELGAAWLNDTNQSLVWSYCKRFGLTPVTQNIEGSVASEDENGNCHLFPFGGLPNLEQSTFDNIVTLRDTVEKASLNRESFRQPQRQQLDGISFEQFCRDSGAGVHALHTARLWCRGTLGQEPSEVSALAFLEIARGGLGIVNLRYDGVHGAQRLRLQEGTQSIAIGISKLMPSNVIHLNQPVSSVSKESPEIYTVTTNTGNVFKARKVVISIPGPSYKSITFSPSLPPLKHTYTTTARYGCYIKFITLFKSPFWRRQGCCGLAQSFRGPLNHCRDTSVDAQNNYALTCFMASAPGRKWMALSPEERVDSVLQQLGSLFGVGYEVVKTEYLGSMTSEWMEDKWAGWGCPFAAVPPGIIGTGDDGDMIIESSGGLYFVGTELTNEWRGYMEGALRSGKRGAAQVLAALQSDETRL